MNSKGPWDLRLDSLLKRIEREKIEEVVLAIGTDVESDATAGFIKELLKDRKVKVTRLAFGLPVGSGVGYSDPVTLQRALKGRQSV
jgi:recombination protein RecR